MSENKAINLTQHLALWTKCKEWFAAKTHSHTKSQITDFPASMPASDVQSWAKAASKPTYTASEVGAAATGHTHSAATGSAAGLMSAADKAKLDGVAAGANAYVHPNHTAKASGLYKIIVDALGHVTGATAVAKNDITGLGIPAQDTTYSPATGSAAGLMSAADKAKLDGIEAGANAYTHPIPSFNASSASSNMTMTPASANVKISFSTLKNTVNGTGHVVGNTTTTHNGTLPAATPSAAGVMTALDKTKLDGVASGANAYVHPASSGNKHIPSGGSSGQILRWNADGTAAWGAENDTTYGEATTVNAGLMSAVDKQKLDGLSAGSGGGTGGGGGDVEWNFELATALPATVASNTVLAIVANASVTKKVSATEPASPTTGMVWFHVDDIGDRRLMSNGACEFWMYGAYQWSGSAWLPLTTYMSFLGSWEKLDGLPPAGTTLDNCTWAQIDAIGRAGKAADYFCVGDTKAVTLTTGEAIVLRIIDFAHDDMYGGLGKAPITFNMTESLAAVRSLNPSATNIGGYGGSAFYPTLTTTIYGTLPADLRAVIKTVTKLTSAGNMLTTLDTTNDNIFLMSTAEVTDAVGSVVAGEGTIYAYFTNADRRKKKVGGTVVGWWTRSPHKSNNSTFIMITADGAQVTSQSQQLRGISFALCV